MSSRWCFRISWWWTQVRQIGFFRAPLQSQVQSVATVFEHDEEMKTIGALALMSLSFSFGLDLR